MDFLPALGKIILYDRCRLLLLKKCAIQANGGKNEDFAVVLLRPLFLRGY